MEDFVFAKFNYVSWILDATEESFRFLVDADNMSKWILHVYFKYFLFASSVNNVIICIVTIVITMSIHGNFDVKYLYHPMKAELVQVCKII